MGLRAEKKREGEGSRDMHETFQPDTETLSPETETETFSTETETDRRWPSCPRPDLGRSRDRRETSRPRRPN
jgi:hypothetical protein